MNKTHSVLAGVAAAVGFAWAPSAVSQVTQQYPKKAIGALEKPWVISPLGSAWGFNTAFESNNATGTLQIPPTTVWGISTEWPLTLSVGPVNEFGIVNCALGDIILPIEKSTYEVLAKQVPSNNPVALFFLIAAFCWIGVLVLKWKNKEALMSLNGLALMMGISAITEISASTTNTQTSFYSKKAEDPSSAILRVDAMVNHQTGMIQYTIVRNPNCTIVIPPANSLPIANPDISPITPYGAPVTKDVLANDRDPDGDTLSIVGTPTSRNGTVIKNSDNSLTFTPNPGFSGTEIVNYTISDGKWGTANGIWTITVGPAPVDTAPSDLALSGVQRLTAGSLTVWQKIGDLSCVDFAPSWLQNSCTYSLLASETRFAIWTDGKSLVVNNASLAAGIWWVLIKAIDNGWREYTEQVSITVNATPDNTPPAITLTWPSVVNLNVGDTYTEQWASCLDNKDGTRPITITWSVNTSVAGIYILTYACSDLTWNPATITRKINVLAPNLSGPTLSQPTVSWSSSLLVTAWEYRARTDRGPMTIENIIANDPEWLGAYTIVSSLFGTLTSGAGTLPVSVNSWNPTGRFGTVDTITITSIDLGNPPKSASKTVTINYNR
jgi:hypothetical protein